MRIKQKPINFDLATQGVSQSLLGHWTKCRVLGRYQLEGWELPLNKEAAAFGSLFHKMLEHGYNSVRTTKTVPDFKDLMDRWLKDNAGRIQDMQMVEVLMAKAEAIWEPYWRQWWDEDVENCEWVASEAQFDIRWHGYRLRGMRDGIFVRKNTVTLLESKTKTRIDPYGLLLALPYDWQNQFYLIASRAEGTPVRHVCYNCIRRPALRQGKRETLPEYANRMKEHVADKPDDYFIRFEISYSEATLARFEQELLLKLRDFEAWLKNPEFTYPVQAACQGFWNCEFMEACSSGDMVGYTRTHQLFRELSTETGE